MNYEDTRPQSKAVTEAEAAVLYRCKQRLANRTDGVVTNVRDERFLLGVGVLKGKLRYAVAGPTMEAIDDPVAFADRLSDDIIAWLDRQEAESA